MEKQTNGTNENFNGNVHHLAEQSRIVQEFFLTDSGAEMIGSLNSMIEAFLFSGDLENVTLPMRTDIVNNLRVATMIAKLERTFQKPTR